MTQPHYNLRSGFTLIEAITAITIMSVIGLLMTFVLAETIERFADASTQSGLNLELSVALDQVSRELRSIPLDETGSSPVPDITSITPSSIAFGSGGSLTTNLNNLIMARSGEPSATIMTQVTSLTIEAYDESNAPLTLPLTGTGCDSIRRLSITMTAEQQGLSETLRTRIFIRSMGGT